MSNPTSSLLLRLALFATALLLLPALAVQLSGRDWPDANVIEGNAAIPLLLGTLIVAACGLILDTHTYRRSGISLLRKQRAYLLWCAGAGAFSAMLLAYLNLYAGSWISPVDSPAEMVWLSALLGAVLLPVVLIMRLWLAGFAGLLHYLVRGLALPAPGNELGIALLLLVSFSGLLGGAVWPELLFWLLWLAPLLLLAALQLLWHESTVFSGLKQGDWSRVLLGGVAGIGAGSLALLGYWLCGGALYLSHSAPVILLALAIYGLLCLQLGDIIAEHWRGKSLLQIYQTKKPFPISVVSKKD